MNLKTKTVGAIGAAGGGVTIIGALIALFTYLSNTDNLYAVVLVMGKLHNNVELNDTDIHTLVNLAAVIIALVGAIGVSLAAAWLGKSPLPVPPATETP